MNNISICITGKLNSITREEAKERVEELEGFTYVSSVKKGLSFLVTNDKDSGSSKNRKAQVLGIKIINEEQFLALTSEFAEGSSDEPILPTNPTIYDIFANNANSDTYGKFGNVTHEDIVNELDFCLDHIPGWYKDEIKTEEDYRILRERVATFLESGIIDFTKPLSSCLGGIALSDCPDETPLVVEDMACELIERGIMSDNFDPKTIINPDELYSDEPQRSRISGTIF